MICPKCEKKPEECPCDIYMDETVKKKKNRYANMLLIYSFVCMLVLTALYLLGKTDIGARPWNIIFAVGLMVLGDLDFILLPLPAKKNVFDTLEYLFFWQCAALLEACFLCGISGMDVDMGMGINGPFWQRLAIIVFPVFITVSYFIFPALRYMRFRKNIGGENKYIPFKISAALLCLVLLIILFLGAKAQWVNL